MSKKRILVVEPSPFRRNETYVIGPFGRVKAYFKAWMIVNRNPFSEVRVMPAECKVLSGDRILYDGKTGENHG